MKTTNFKIAEAWVVVVLLSNLGVINNDLLHDFNKKFYYAAK